MFKWLERFRKKKQDRGKPYVCPRCGDFIERTISAATVGWFSSKMECRIEMYNVEFGQPLHQGVCRSCFVSMGREALAKVDQNSANPGDAIVMTSDIGVVLK